MNYKLVRALTHFSKSSDAYVGEHRLAGIDMDRVRMLFGMPPDHPMYDVYSLGRLAELVRAFDKFYADSFGWLRSFSERHRQKPAKG